MNTVNVVSDWLLSAELAPDVENDPLRPLYEAAARGELALPFCVSCALPLELEQYVCDGAAPSNETGAWWPPRASCTPRPSCTDASRVWC